MLIGLYSIVPGRDFGIALIIFTIFVRMALYPLVKRQLHQTQAMKKLQPELARIKAKAKGNKQLETTQMMEMYKKNGINPFRTILILLIQLPIFFALFLVIQIFTNDRDKIIDFTYGFMQNIEPIKQLIANPDQFNEKLLGVVDLTKTAITSDGISFFLILLAFIAAITQYIMSKQTMPQTESKKGLRALMAEAAEGKTANQAEMNAAVMGKMIKFLPIFMFFIMISVPGALALYYAVSNMVAVAQQSYLLRQDEDELEELADAGTTVKTASINGKSKQPGKKATAKARAKEAKIVKPIKSSSKTNVTRIKAKESKR